MAGLCTPRDGGTFAAFLALLIVSKLLFGFTLNTAEESSAIPFRSDEVFCLICSVFC